LQHPNRCRSVDIATCSTCRASAAPTERWASRER
jgi:hypothetical protein